MGEGYVHDNIVTATEREVRCPNHSGLPARSLFEVEIFLGLGSCLCLWLDESEAYVFTYVWGIRPKPIRAPT